MKFENRLKRMFAEILMELQSNPAFEARLRAALEEPEIQSSSKKARRRRSPAVLDPVRVYEEGNESILRRQLQELTVDQLKDIVAEHGMDQAKLVMKWNTPARIIDHILGSARLRSKKGDAFR